MNTVVVKLTYLDLWFVCDLVDLFGAGRLANNKRDLGRLAGYSVCLYEDTIEVYGPMVGGLDLMPMAWTDDLPSYCWRDEATNRLFRVDLALIAHLAAEGRYMQRNEGRV